MKNINQIIHLTDSIETIKSILKNGFYTSYTKEKLGRKNVLIPMISFSNVLFRDIGESEVINYGNYGIVFDRDDIIEKFDLNPVFYVRNESNMEQVFQDNFQNSIVPQILSVAKDFYNGSNFEKFSNHIAIKPLSLEIKNLLDTLDKNVNDEFISSLKIVFENYFINTKKQMLLMKPYKVKTKNNKSRIAYNEREWRKSFFDLNYISEITPKGKKNKEYEKWLNTEKPHYKTNHILEFNIEDVKCIYVKNENDIREIEEFSKANFNKKPSVFTLNQLKEMENKNGF